jgi:hypothetical protein
MRRLARPAPLLLLLLAGGCTDLDATSAPDDVLRLTVTPRALPADGFSSAQVVVEVSPRTEERFRDISLSTTLGSFPAGTSPGARSLVVTADASGRAIATLRSAAQTGTATVAAEIRDGDLVKASQSVQVPFEPVAVSSVVTLQLASTSAPADGATVTTATAKVASALPSEQRTVTFATTAGSFGAVGTSTLQVRAGSDDLAIAGLVSPRSSGAATVSATVNGLVARRNVEFTHAFPDAAVLSVSGSFRLTASFASKASLRLDLTRGSGTVTRGTEVAFEAVDDSSGQAFGYFNGVTASDINGVVTADFTPGNTPERGEATLRATVVGTRVQATAKIEVISPS